MTVRVLCACVLLFSAAILAFAEESREEKMRRSLTLQRDVQQAFAEKDYKKALAACEAMTNAFPKQADAVYNLACALARLNRANEALGAISNSLDLGFADSELMKSDEDFASIRTARAFDELVKRARQNELNAPFDKGSKIKGVKTVEGFPEGGLRYRLRMSETATTNKPNRLIVWLHPSGGSMNSTVEAMAPGFIEKGFALLVPTQKSWGGWSEPDAKRLMSRTLPDVAKIEGVDARRPILLGFSAGGQLALILWRDAPQDFGGIVLDAAYPVGSTRASSPEDIPLLSLPENKDFANSPVFGIIGERDQNGIAKKVWERARTEWQPRVPVTLHIVPGKGHEWLFGKDQTALLHQWLSKTVATRVEPVPLPAATNRSMLESFVGRDLRGISDDQARSLQSFIHKQAKSPSDHSPWYVWRTGDTNRSHYVVLEKQISLRIPGASSVMIHLLDQTGRRVNSWAVQTGWRMTPCDALLTASEDLATDMLAIVSEAVGWTNRLFFALSGDKLDLVRMEDADANLVRNDYKHPNFTIGASVEGVTEKEWIAWLGSKDPVDVLRALVFLSGVHMDPDRPETEVAHEDLAQARVFRSLQTNAVVRRLLEQHRRSAVKWIREAAEKVGVPEDGKPALKLPPDH